jgi:hypothetical protein
MHAMVMDEKKRLFYEQTLQTAKEEIDGLNRTIERELMEVTSRVNELKEEKEAIRQVCRGACRMLGTECELDAEEEYEGEDSEGPEA